MTQPAPQPPARAPYTLTVPVNLLRALLSICETAAFIFAGVQAAMDNGQDMNHAIITALVGFMCHGINHNAGGSPV
jgi:hypothetical protein